MKLKKNGFRFVNHDFVDSVMNRTKPESGTKVLPLEQMILDLSKLSDEDWGRYAFYRDPLYGKFDRSEIKDYTNNAIQCARKVFKEISEKYKYEDLDHLAKELKFNIRQQYRPNDGNRVIFAQFTEPNNITIYTDTITKYNDLIKNSNSLAAKVLGDIDVYKILVAHELFHGIEFMQKNSIYTQTEKVELWKKPFSNKSKIFCLGEIAAMEFSKQLSGMDFSPFILDTVLMYAYDKEAATLLYEDTMNL